MSDPVLELLLDPERLSALVGRPVRATRIRPKPGVGHTLALVDPDDATPLGWLRALIGSSRSKAGKLRAASGTMAASGTLAGPSTMAEPVEASGPLAGPPTMAEPVEASPVDRPGERSCPLLAINPGEAELAEHEAVVLWGPIGTDPALVRQLAPLDLLDQPVQVLRHNPGRRLVLRHGNQVWRITEKEHRGTLIALAAELAAAGVGVVAPADSSTGSEPSAAEPSAAEPSGTKPTATVPPATFDERVSRWPWLEGHDLSRRADQRELAQAGRALARLHSAPRERFGALPARGWADSHRAAARAVDQLVEVAPRAGVLAQDVLLTLPTVVGCGHRVVLHGDFSTDQCLSGPDRVLLTDFDRACLGPAQIDLAGLHATALLAEQDVTALLTAYQHELSQASRFGVAGRAPSAAITADLAPWVTAALLARVTEPWRSQRPDWERETLRQVAIAQQVLWNPADLPGGAWSVPAVLECAEGDRLKVGRAWPDPTGQVPRVSLEGTDSAGRVRAGYADARGHVEVLDFAADPKLPTLHALATGRQSDLGRVVVHRAGRRAVVAMPDRYVKVVRRGKAEKLATAARTGRTLAVRAGLEAPEVLDADGPGGSEQIAMAVLPGFPVGQFAGHSSWTRIWEQWANGWTRLQALGEDPVAAGLPRHDDAAEARTLQQWLERCQASGVLYHTPWPRRLAALTEQLYGCEPAPALVPSHRDLHDKQLLWHDERLGVLDFDTACLAAPELDLVNLAVHADLRAAQGLWSPAAVAVVQQASRRVAAAGATPVSPQRWERARLATVARLAAVYAHRPRWREQVLAWAEDAWQD